MEANGLNPKHVCFILFFIACMPRNALASTDDVCSSPSPQNINAMTKREITDLVCAIDRATHEHGTKAKEILKQIDKISVDDREEGLRKTVEGLTHTAMQYRCLAVAQGVLRVADKRFGVLASCGK